MIDFAADPLDAFAARVLGVLAEKAFLTPDVYPLSVNALVNGANQLSNRDPVMSISEATVQQSLAKLQAMHLVRTYYPVASRVAKYEHLLREVFSLDDARLALVTTLLLRGAQTPGELRGRTTRMYPFASVESVERSLEALASEAPPLVRQLPRAPGTKESRWMHLMGGEVALERQEVAAGFSGSGQIEAAPEDRVTLLTREVTDLRRELEHLRQEFATFRKAFE
jgi:hypothetical protein